MVQKLTCLVIEDNLFDQKMIKRAAAAVRAEADFTFADSLRDARLALQTHRYSIILCDNSLPDGNGTDFVQKLSGDPKHRQSDIVIISGWPSPFMWAKARAAGLQIIDKNDQPQVKLMAIFNRKLGRSPGEPAGERRRKFLQ